MTGTNEFMWLKPFLKSLTIIWNLQFRLVKRFILDGEGASYHEAFSSDPIKPEKLLVVWREFNGSNDWALRVISEKFRSKLGENASLIVRTRKGKVFRGNNQWLRNEVADLGATHLVVLDAHLLAFPSPLGLWQARNLASYLKESNVQLSIVMFDLPEPHMLSNLLVLQSHLSCNVHLICSTANEGRSFGLNNVFGPDLALFSRDIAESNVRFENRGIDVHLARPNYEPRRRMVSYIHSKLIEADVNVVIGGASPTPADFRKSLENTRITVVTNRMITPGPIGKWPLPGGPSKHAVSYNAEAIESGCLLISEQCDALDALFEPYRDYVPYQNIEEVPYLVDVYLSDPGRSQEIIESAQRRLVELRSQAEDSLWRLF